MLLLLYHSIIVPAILSNSAYCSCTQFHLWFTFIFIFTFTFIFSGFNEVLSTGTQCTFNSLTLIHYHLSYSAPRRFTYPHIQPFTLEQSTANIYPLPHTHHALFHSISTSLFIVILEILSYQYSAFYTSLLLFLQTIFSKKGLTTIPSIW